MTHLSPYKVLLQRFTLIFIALSMILISFTPSISQAGKQGVFINESVYFSLDQVSLTSGTETQSLHFTLDLNNNSDQLVNFNDYGIRVLDTKGISYSAQLVEKINARVQPKQMVAFKFVASVPPKITYDQLRVNIFAWDFSRSDYMQDMGSLTVSAAVNPKQLANQQLVLHLDDIDASLADDALLSFELLRSYKVLTNGGWSIYSDVMAINQTNKTLKLPTGLTYQIIDSAQFSYPASVTYGGDQNILPHQQNMITIQAAMGEEGATDKYTLEFAKKTTPAGTGTAGTSGSTGSGTSGTSGSAGSGSSAASATTSVETTVFGSLNLAGSFKVLTPGEVVLYISKGKNGLSILNGQSSYTIDSDGLHVDSTYTLRNDSKTILNLPALTGVFQIGQSTLTISASEIEIHPLYLAPLESTTYHFTALFPLGVNPGNVQLVVSEKKMTGTAATFIPISISQLPETSTTIATGKASDGVVTSFGRIGITLVSTFRMPTDSGDDVIMSEVQLENLDTKIITLPNLAGAGIYAGYMIGEFDASSKVVRIQTSPHLNPKQKTSIYIYSKIPYTMELAAGYLYLGNGVMSTPTSPWTQTKEWAKLSYPSSTAAFTSTTAESEWFIQDSGRMSTAKIVDSQIYDINGQKMLTTRILQTNKEFRNGIIVPYTGYLTSTDGSSILALKTTDDSALTTKMCKDCTSLSTLWVAMPNGFSTEKQQFNFGQKADDQAYIAPKQYTFTPTPGAVSGNETSLIVTASVYPYTLNFKNALMSYFTTGTGASQTKTYTITYDYAITKTIEAVGMLKNRSLEIVVTDYTGKTVKTWNTALDGSGASSLTSNKLTILPSEMSDLDAFTNFVRKINFYEKFEGGTRLLGSLQF